MTSSSRTGDIKTYQIDRVGFNRQLELAMLDGSKDDLWRIGVELAYTVGKQKFGLADLVIEDPSPGHRSLYSRSGKALLEARILDLRKVATDQRQERLRSSMNQMVAALREDLKSAPSAEVGYAILSHISENKIVSIWISEVPK